MITVGELFAGIGGLGLGLEMTGRFEVAWQVEKDDFANKILAKHWPDVRRWNDVCTFPPNDGEWKVDMITAGFPCQDISSAGQKKGIDGERSGLFFEALRIFRTLRPEFILLENVSRLLVRDVGTVLGELAEIGYDAEWHCLPAVSLGAPHRRDRVFILAYPKHDGSRREGTNVHERERQKMGGSQLARGDGRNGEMAERRDDGWYCLRCGLAIFGGCGCDHGEWQCDKCGEWTYPFYYDRSDGCQNCGHEAVADTVSKRRRSRPARSEYATYVRQPPRREEYRNWDSESGIRRVADGVSNRIHRLRCLGNAVVPQIAHFIGKQMLEVIDD